MAKVKSFKALRPREDLVEKVSVLPFDVVERRDAKSQAKDNLYSFYHITRPEIKFPLSVDFDDPKVYRSARKNLRVFERDGILYQEDSDKLYLYRQINESGVSQTGFVGLTSIQDYNNNVIKRHELTTVRRERDRFMHFDSTDANTEPVLLMYRDNDILASIIERIIQTKPDYEVVTDDNVTHIVWTIEQEEDITLIEETFDTIDSLYIADGHHRVASAARLAEKRRNQIPHPDGSEGFMFFPAVICPATSVGLYEHNRVIHDLNGFTKEELLEQLQELYEIEVCKNTYKPVDKHIFGMYVDKTWYKLTLKSSLYNFDTSLDHVDAELLEQTIIEPILGINDLRNTSRVSFVGGPQGLKALEEKTDEFNGVGFSMFSINVDEIMDLSDEGFLLPTTSTWFEPKLRAGLFVHKFNSFSFEDEKTSISKQTKEYIEFVLSKVEKKDAHQNEFVQAVTEVLHSLGPVLEKNPHYIDNNILERIVEPERIIKFRVPWVDDEGNIQVNRGFRVQFNGAIGPYKGGLRFHPSVYEGMIKFLGFEQIFKNSLTGLPIGGGKGGSDFDPRGKSDEEIRRFCESFMTELSRHIGESIDVPAGDIGVGAREIGFLFGHYRRLKGAFENGVLTGKGLNYGGSLIRPEATGYGATYFGLQMLRHDETDYKNKEVAVSGFGNVAWGVCKKVRDLGGKVVTLSGPEGYVYDPEGVITEEKINFMLEMRANTSGKIEDYANKFGVEFFKGKKPWERKVDVIIPCATQNEILEEDALQIIKNGVKYIVEGSNMPTTNEALKLLKDAGVVVAPGKAANAGGVATSALEMSQNAMRLSWTQEEVDAKLKVIMKNIYQACVLASSRYGFGYDLVAGANIAGFTKVADAMIDQGKY